MATSPSCAVADGPVMTFISKRIRSLKKKLNRIAQMESGKTLNKEQQEMLRSKASVVSALEELENIRPSLSAAVAQEISLALKKNNININNSPAMPKTYMKVNCDHSRWVNYVDSLKRLQELPAVPREPSPERPSPNPSVPLSSDSKSSAQLTDDYHVALFREEFLLAHLPSEVQLWPSELEHKRLAYKILKDEAERDPDMEIIKLINRDLECMRPDMYNQDAMRNILCVFSRFNPEIRYAQGMNEILAPIYYVISNDRNEDNAIAAEAAAFYCFVDFTMPFRENFVQDLDKRADFIRFTISKLYRFLEMNDLELWHHLEVKNKVNPESYATRWITLLLTREFTFPEILLVWDALITSDSSRVMLLSVCCAMLILVRSHLLAGDRTSNLKLLQNYPPIDIPHLLSVAKNLRTI